MQTLDNFFKCLRLTQEEWDYYWKTDRKFWKKYNLQYLPNWPLRKKIAMALQELAVNKLVKEANKKEAIEHHLKACSYDPDIAFRRPCFRKEVGLPVFKYSE